MQYLFLISCNNNSNIFDAYIFSFSLVFTIIIINKLIILVLKIFIGILQVKTKYTTLEV